MNINEIFDKLRRGERICISETRPGIGREIVLSVWADGEWHYRSIVWKRQYKNNAVLKSKIMHEFRELRRYTGTLKPEDTNYMCPNCLSCNVELNVEPTGGAIYCNICHCEEHFGEWDQIDKWILQ